MIQNRLVLFIMPVLVWTLGGLLLLAILASVAHADAGAPAPERAIDPTSIAAWVGAVLALALVTLRIIAPLTRTTWDDRLLARLEALEDVVHGPGKPSAPPRPPSSSIAGMIGVLVIGAGLALQPACATAERAGNAGKVAALRCGEPQLATAAALIARWAVQDALAGEVDWAAHEADALGFGLGIGTCAYAEVRRAWKARPVVQALAVGPAPDDGSAGLERLRAKLGGVPIQLADGTVL